MDVKLDHHHRLTVTKIFRHPLSHNIQWHDVMALLERLGEVGESHRGNVTLAVGGDVHSLGHPQGRDLNEEQVIKVRHLLAALKVVPEAA